MANENRTRILRGTSDWRSALEEAPKDEVYWDCRRAICGYTESLHRLMESRGVSKAELAKRVGTSLSYVTGVLRGSVNPTLRNMIRLARVLEGEVYIHVAGEENYVDFKETKREE